jgi:hypothetical protein
MQLEHLLKARDVIFGFLKMMLQTRLEIAIAGLADHVRQRFENLLLGVIDILKLMDVKIVHGFDVSGEQAHKAAPFQL